MEWVDANGAGSSIEITRRNAYPLMVGRGKLASLPSLLASIAETDSVFIVTDDHVAPIYLDRTVALARSAGLSVKSVAIPQGELSKSWNVAERLLATLASDGAKRRTILLALGGGVLCDLVGFVASIFMRGVPYVNVPTTLMAQLDAAIGGKTGIDFHGSKNLVGSFYHPCAVLVDPALLTTLPRREIRSGLAEAIKVGILRPALFERLERFGSSWNGDTDAIDPIVRETIAGKLQLLRDDPFERSLLRLLNLGHTVGHALESATDFVGYRHGEAVAIGIAVAAQVSRLRGFCGPDVCERIANCLRNCALPILLPEEHATATWRELDVIRRIRNGRLNEVLPVTIGQCEIVDEVATDDYVRAVRSLYESVSDPGREP